MKKILLLLFVFLYGICNVYSYDIASSFYYDDEKVSGMWITREKNSIVMSGLPFVLKRKEDNAIVYCLEPFVMLKQEEGYQGYYENNSYFKLSDEELERIRLLAYFGYMYPSHEDIKWYGITQYLIWKTVDKEADIYFSDVRYGAKVTKYEEEISEIENLITNYKELSAYSGKTYKFYSLAEFDDFKNQNILFKYIENNKLVLPKNSSFNSEEVFFYHESGQDLYMPGGSIQGDFEFEFNFLRNITIRKWYGSGKYKVEEGAKFEICSIDGECFKITTDENGESFLELDYGIYTIKQLKGKKGYKFIEEQTFEVTDNSNNLIELYNEAIVVSVPDTYKGNFITDIIMRIRWMFYDYKYR